MRKKRTTKRRRNPRGKHIAGATAAMNRQYEAILKSERKRGVPLKEAKRIAAATARKLAKKNPPKSEYDFYSRMLTILKRDPYDGIAAGGAERSGKLLGYTKARIDKDIAAAKAIGKKSYKETGGKYIFNPRRRRNKAPTISEADISRLSSKAQAQLRAQLDKVEEKEQRAETPRQKAAAKKARRSWLSRLGTRLRVIGQTSRRKVSARDLSRCKRRTVKVRARHDTDAISKAQAQLGRGYDDFKVMNPRPARRKVNGKYVDLIIRGKAKKTPQGWRLAGRTFEQGRGTVKVSSGYYLDRHTGLVFAKRERNASSGARTRVKHVESGYRDALGVWHSTERRPKAASYRVGDTVYMHWAVPHAGLHSGQAATIIEKAKGRYKVQSSTGEGWVSPDHVTKRKENPRRRSRRNPSPKELRREFAGRVGHGADLYFPSSTPHGLAKLGKLVEIQTEEGTIKPVHGSAWLCADKRGRLHIGSVSGADVYSGPKRDFGHVKRIEYEESKPHLGYKSPIIWTHKMAEGGGVRPRLYADGEGGLVFKGGSYQLGREGIIG
jgi:hypothetical protein